MISSTMIQTCLWRIMISWQPIPIHRETLARKFHWQISLHDTSLMVCIFPSEWVIIYYPFYLCWPAVTWTISFVFTLKFIPQTWLCYVKQTQTHKSINIKYYWKNLWLAYNLNVATTFEVLYNVVAFRFLLVMITVPNLNYIHKLDESTARRQLKSPRSLSGRSLHLTLVTKWSRSHMTLKIQISRSWPKSNPLSNLRPKVQIDMFAFRLVAIRPLLVEI